MSMELSKKEEVVTLETVEKPELSVLEAEKNDQEFASEILSKIENEMSAEPVSQIEIQKIDSSVELANPAMKEEIQKELDLENKLDQLNNEAKIAGGDAKSKISETTGLDKENKQELQKFSKRYSAFYRDQIAGKIKNLRFQNQTKIKEKPLEIEALKLSIDDERSSSEKIKSEKLGEQEIQKDLEEKRVKLNLEIQELKDGLNKRKNSLIYKIQEKFISNKFNEETFEILKSERMTKYNIKNKIYQKDFGIYQDIKIKEGDLELINKNIEFKKQKLEEQDILLEKLKVSIEDKYKSINEAEKVIESDSEIKEIEKNISDFYTEISKQKEIIENEKKERSVSEISKEKNVLFCHAIPLHVETGDSSFSQNNTLIKTNEFSVEEKIKMILGVEPTISVSTINKENQTLARGFGLILNEGQVLSAYAGDAGTLLDKGIYNRRSKYDRELETSVIQKDIENNLNFAINHLQKRDQKTNSSVETMHQGWNELVIENPQVAGLFFQKDNQGNAPSDFARAKLVSEQLNLPLYILDKEKTYQIDKKTNELKEISKEDIFTFSKSFSKNERKDLVEEMIDKETFNVKKENIYQFNGYNVGKAYYKFMKKVDAGERVSIQQIGDNKNLNEGDEIVHLFDQTYAIRKIELTEKQWELFGNQNWENSGGYYKTGDESDYNFNTKFGGQLVWEPHSKFAMDAGDSISSYINKIEKELEKNKKSEEEIKKGGHGDIQWVSTQRRSVNSILLGFAEECQKNNDIKNYEKALSILGKFGNPKEYENFVDKRIGQDGKFKYLNEDIPVEVRNKLKDLKK